MWLYPEFGCCGKNCYFETFNFLRGINNVYLGDNVYIGAGMIIETYENAGVSPRLEIGDNFFVTGLGHISCLNSIKIGKNVLIGRRVFITDNAHGVSDFKLIQTPPILRPLYSKGGVVIDDNVWIGENVSVLPGVHIGYGAIVGANSLITKDVPSFCVVGGNPQKILKELN